MTCEDLEARIAEFLAGELDDRSGVEEHLVACAECRGKFSIARSGWQAADEWRVSGPSGDAIAATLAAIEPQQPAEALTESDRQRQNPSEGGTPSKPLLRFLQLGTMAASIAIAFAIGTSSREKPAADKPAPVAMNQVKPRSAGLASLRPSVGLLYVQDEQGRPAGELAITRLKVNVEIRDGIARTEIEEVFQNRTDQRLEGTFQFPLPPDASISRLAMEIDGKLMEGEVVERQKARQTYEGIVRSMKDPALLEWMPGGLFQCRIFPIEPRSDKRIVIAYTQALSVFDGRARYVYPLAGESMRELGIGRFELAAMIRSGSKIVKAASTSHDAPTIRLNDHAMRTTFAFSDFRPRSDFVIAFETEVKDELQVSAHRPEGAEPGYFAAFVTPRIDRDEELRRDRKLFFLMDVSGSVAQSELEAARLVIRRMIDALGPADRFRIGCHNLMVGAMTESVAPDEAGKRAADRYLSDLAAAGASDVATALETTLSHYMADNGELVYVGEGTPTWGEKDPAKIVARLRAAVGARRISIRTVAVGSDAEKGLLETISREFNGGSHSVSPSDDVASRADEIARTLGRSALSHLKAEFEGAVTDAAPGTLGSIHFGERLLVTGRYGSGPVKLVLAGKVHDRTIRKEFALALPDREGGNLHVKRLWAQRRLADLVAQGDAKRDETVKLSVAHQVMTPHTSFLVLENEQAYEQHRIDRTKKDADQSNDPAKKEVAKLTRRRELEPLFSQARAHFERQEYSQCIEACDRMLAIDASLSYVDEMKLMSQRLNHAKTDPQVTRPYIEKWQRAFDEVEVMGIVQDEQLSPPARRAWLNALRQRKPKGILGSEEGDLPRLQTPAGGYDIGGVGFTDSDELSDQGTMGRLLNDPQDGTFLDPDGGGGPLALQPYDPEDGTRYRLARSYRLPLTVKERDIQVATAAAAADPIPPSATEWDVLHRKLVGEQQRLWGINQSVAVNGVGASETLLTLLNGNSDATDLYQGWGYEGSGFMGLPHEGAGADFTRLAPGVQFPVEQTSNGGLAFSPGEGKHRNSALGLRFGEQGVDKLVAGVNDYARELEIRLQESQELERLRQRYQETIAALNGSGMKTELVTPRHKIDGQVTAFAGELDLVVISVGRDAGVNEGDEFTIYRGKEFIAKTTIDRVNRAGASGRVTLKGKEVPKVGDFATNGLLATPGKSGDSLPHPTPPPERKVVKITGDELAISGIEPARVKKGMCFVLSRDWKYVAAVEVTDVLETIATARVLRRFRASDIQEGDLAVRVDTFKDLWSVLPDSIRKDFLSDRSIAEARAKLRLLRAMKGGAR